uniref:Uncharacterized protein n=2 Tax=Klebsiella pneumoniae TaxID=573 RepID=A0A6M6A4B1_KLEPN|nr:hypothetical protein pVir-SCNJ1-52 [Klebsiella pneumoniae subsp. pneumoniae]QGW59091.1 hypothetical protein pKpnU95_00259 [Klebsiella pneumoniae]QJX12848.1 hypothetical protein [Klebsiella pneumoniae]QJX13328.1 hypothetical protein [Klebsiella pneumoniae]QJX13460.1 hypothetical protein [Klebsiella pneumoniae]
MAGHRRLCRAGTTGVYCTRQLTLQVGAEGNGLLYAMSG